MVREVAHEGTKDGNGLSLQSTPLTMRPGVSQQLRADEPARQPAPGEEQCLLVHGPYSRNDSLASWSFHTAPPYGGSTPVPRESLLHPEEHTPWLA